ncbi:hypothetical protein [Clostridium yunnanense]|uniref:hypothetical protein n=1 Tax=Clostridium yunnanense TaxID=2800325 RepID=UPI00190852A0|nr:hypothetical protein [Clostridium yunnanense]
MAPLIAVLLILSFLVYILTNPFQAISSFFIGNELNYLQEIVSSYSYEQLVNPNYESYIESSRLFGSCL